MAMAVPIPALRKSRRFVSLLIICVAPFQSLLRNRVVNPAAPRPAIGPGWWGLNELAPCLAGSVLAGGVLFSISR
jgi:hypothetical protein